MEHNKENDMWIGTPIEHLKKLLETHDCFCDKAKKVIELIIDTEQKNKAER